MKRTLTIYFAILVVFSSILFSETAFVKQVPNGAKFDCLTCHTSSKGGKGWNNFGTTIRTSYLTGTTIKWGTALASLDSDGDGITNGQELGDPKGTWKTGMTNPGVLANVTNPGDKTSFTGVEELLLAADHIQINSFYPNPGNANSVLNFNLKEAGLTNLSIFTANGAFVATAKEVFLDAGEYNFKVFTHIDYSKLTNGVYYIKLTSGRYFTIQKVVINN